MLSAAFFLLAILRSSPSCNRKALSVVLVGMLLAVLPLAGINYLPAGTHRLVLGSQRRLASSLRDIAPPARGSPLPLRQRHQPITGVIPEQIAKAGGNVGQLQAAGGAQQVGVAFVAGAQAVVGDAFAEVVDAVEADVGAEPVQPAGHLQVAAAFDGAAQVAPIR